MGEDRLTELLAHVLAADDLFRTRFCRLCGVPALANADLRTQRRLSTGRRVDLELLARENGARHVVWVEVKAGALEQPSQLHDYADELHRLYGDHGTLVALAPKGDRIFEHARTTGRLGRPLARSLTWQQVDEAIRQTGQERAGMSWRDEAALARTSALQRTLLDFHAYLQRRKEPLAIMPDDPLQVTDALALSRVPALLDRGGLIDTILDLAAAYVSDRAIERWDDRDWRGRVFRNLDPPGWAAELVNEGGAVTAQLWYCWTDVDDRPDEPRHQPIFLASLVFERPTEDGRVALADPQWSLPDWAVSCMSARNPRISAIRYLAEVATAGITLGAQAEALGTWARDKLVVLKALSRPPVEAA